MKAPYTRKPGMGTFKKFADTIPAMPVQEFAPENAKPVTMEDHKAMSELDDEIPFQFMNREHRGDLDLEVKIKDLEFECKVLNKNNKMFKEHNAELQNTIDRLTTMNKSHKTINGQLRVRLTRLEQEVKDLRAKVKDDEELIKDLYEYP